MSTKITKQKATELANIMVSNSIGKSIDALRIEKRDKIAALVLAKIPADLIELSRGKYAGYFTFAGYAAICHNGVDRLESKLEVKIPSPGIYSVVTEVTKKEHAEVAAISRKLEKLKEERTILVRSIEGTLLQLSSYKKIEASFPEAFAAIPSDWLDTASVALAIPIDSIREELLKYSK